MDSSSLGCLVCGVPILSHLSTFAKPWLSQYRAIYGETSQAKLTGVGRYDGSGVWTAPQSFSERWDDEHHGIVELTAIQNHAEDSCSGFFIHNSCWSLLQKSFEPNPVPLQRLLEVCESLVLPSRTSSLSWGNDFGGLWAIENLGAFAWQEEFFQPVHSSAIWMDGQEDPYNVLCIPNMLSIQIQPPFAEPLTKTPQDFFASLPREILEKIAALLVTKDALNLRLASVSFLFLYVSEQFWTSRFSADGERGFLFEARKPKGYLHRLSLYKLSTLSRRPSGLRNRKRVWEMTRIIVDTVERYRAEATLDITTKDRINSSLAWISCDIHPKFEHPRWNQLYGGCRLLGTCSVNLPKDLSQIGISILDTGMCTYVTGLRFKSRHGPAMRIGYIAEQNERLFLISSICGFNIALSRSGMRAIQFVSTAGHCSRWAGNPTDMLVSNSLVKNEPIERLAVSYDGFKLVELAIDVQGEKNTLAKANVSLRQSAWYPHPPSDRVCVNPDSFTFLPTSGTRFRPVLLLDFGGPKGEYLPYITSVCSQYTNGLRGIVFRYGKNPYALTSKKLGHLDLAQGLPSALFEIKSMSGERITNIDIVVEAQTGESGLPKALKGIRLSTNRDRAYRVGAFNTETGLQRLSLAEGTTIVGIYAHPEPDIGLCGLGLISTAIAELNSNERSLQNQ